MIEILRNTAEEMSVRGEAAIGLGRYAENKDLEEYWAQILDCFRVELEGDNLPGRLVAEIIRGVAKYGSDARGLFSLIARMVKKVTVGSK
jgi:hypothetical protein